MVKDVLTVWSSSNLDYISCCRLHTKFTNIATVFIDSRSIDIASVIIEPESIDFLTVYLLCVGSLKLLGTWLELVLWFFDYLSKTKMPETRPDELENWSYIRTSSD